MSAAAALLTAARGLLVTGWCQGTMAQQKSETKDHRGRVPVAWENIEVYRYQDASRWCLEGALKKVREETPHPDDPTADLFTIWDEREAFRLLEQALGLKKGDSLIAWHDEEGRTQEEVIAAIDDAIALTVQRTA